MPFTHFIIDLFAMYTAYQFCVYNRTVLAPKPQEDGTLFLPNADLAALQLMPLFSNMMLISGSSLLKIYVS